MGNSGSRGGAPKGKKIIESKLAQAEKTGVLNLANQDLKPSSSVWDKLLSHGLTTRLKTLDISGNILKSMPAEIYDMELLKTLHVSRCNIQRIHDRVQTPRAYQPAQVIAVGGHFSHQVAHAFCMYGYT